jgi:hypothetical protein
MTRHWSADIDLGWQYLVWPYAVCSILKYHERIKQDKNSAKHRKLMMVFSNFK